MLPKSKIRWPARAEPSRTHAATVKSYMFHRNPRGSAVNWPEPSNCRSESVVTGASASGLSVCTTFWIVPSGLKKSRSTDTERRNSPPPGSAPLW